MNEELLWLLLYIQKTNCIFSSVQPKHRTRSIPSFQSRACRVANENEDAWMDRSFGAARQMNAECVCWIGVAVNETKRTKEEERRHVLSMELRLDVPVCNSATSVLQRVLTRTDVCRMCVSENKKKIIKCLIVWKLKKKCFNMERIRHGAAGSSD